MQHLVSTHTDLNRYTPEGPSAIILACVDRCERAVRMCEINGLRICIRHPILWGGRWRMPIDIVSPDVSMVHCLYNFELKDGNAMDVNGVVLSTLGASNSPVDPIVRSELNWPHLHECTIFQSFCSFARCQVMDWPSTMQTLYLGGAGKITRADRSILQHKKQGWQQWRFPIVRYRMWSLRWKYSIGNRS